MFIKNNYNKLFGSLALYMLIFTLLPMFLVLWIKDSNIVLTITVLAAFSSIYFSVDRKKFVEKLTEKRERPSLFMLLFLILAPMGTNIIGGVFSEGLNRLLVLGGLGFENVGAEMAKEIATSPSFFLAFYTCLLAPLIEELVFRNHLLRGIEKPRPWLAILISAIMFAVMHTNLEQSTSLIVTAIYFSYLGIRYSMWVPILVHVANNTIFYLASLFPSTPDSLMEKVMISLTLFGVFSFIVALVSGVKYFKKTWDTGKGEKLEYAKSPFLWIYFLLCGVLIVLNDFVL